MRRGTVVLSLALLLAGRHEAVAASPDAAELAVLFPAAPTSLDPQLTAAVTSYWYLDNVYEPLFRHAADGSLVPFLGLDWIAEPDGAWVVRLRDGVRFHDGRAFGSADVVASFQRAATLPGSRFTSVAALEGVEAVDRLRVRFRTRLRPGEWQTLLTFLRIVPAGSPAEIVDPVGTGAYRLQVLEPGRRYALTAFAEHWAPSPRFSTVRIGVEPDSRERTRRLLAGEADFVVSLSGTDVAAVEDSRGHWVATSIGTAVAGLVVNDCDAPFADPRIRTALDLALDRERIAEKLDRLVQPTGQFLTPAMLGFDATLEPVPADVERSRRLLVEAGLGDGLEIDLLYNPRARAVATEVASQLAEVGVRARPREVAGDKILELSRSTRDALFVTFQSGSPGDSIAYLMWRFHTPDPARGLGGGNLSHCPCAEMDALLEVAAAAEDAGGRAAQVGAASRLVRERRTHLPLVWGVELFGLRRDLDWIPRVDDLILFAELERRD